MKIKNEKQIKNRRRHFLAETKYFPLVVVSFLRKRRKFLMTFFFSFIHFAFSSWVCHNKTAPSPPPHLCLLALRAAHFSSPRCTVWRKNRENISSFLHVASRLLDSQECYSYLLREQANATARRKKNENFSDPAHGNTSSKLKCLQSFGVFIRLSFYDQNKFLASATAHFWIRNEFMRENEFACERKFLCYIFRYGQFNNGFSRSGVHLDVSFCLTAYPICVRERVLDFSP